MDAERFAEILTEEGYPMDFIKRLWKSDSNLIKTGHRNTSEELLRFIARELKEEGIIERWNQSKEKEE